MLNLAQKAVLKAELQKPEYAGMTSQQAYDYLHVSPDDQSPPRIAGKFTSQELRAWGFNHTSTSDEEGTVTFANPVTMPNMIELTDFQEVFGSL